MRFSKLIISNFRSIGPDGLEIRFSHGQNRANVVGANGSGKTNILTALGIVLGTYPFSRFSVDETDFHVRNSSHPGVR